MEVVCTVLYMCDN